MIEVRRKEKESIQSLLYRFKKSIQQSGILLEARERRFYQRKKSRQAKKRAALRREELKRKYEKLRKLGQLESKL